MDTQRALAVTFNSMGEVIIVGSLNGSADFGGGSILSGGASDVFVAKLKADGSYLWAKRFGDGANQTATGVAVDASGNIVVSGSFQGTLDFGGSPLTNANVNDTRAFVAKFDSSGTPLWSKAYGAASAQASANGVGTDGSGNIFVTGGFGGSIDFGNGNLPSTGGPDIFVAKLQPDGAGIWSHRFGGSDMGYDAASSLAVDSAGGVAIAGSATGTISFGGTTYPGAISVAKFDQAGVLVWSRGYAATFPVVSGIAVDGTGAVVLTGESKSGAGIDFGNGPLPNGGVFLAKFSAGGVPVWNKDFGGNSTAPNVAIDASQNVALVGRFGGSLNLGGAMLTSPAAMIKLDVFLASFDKSGNHVWSKALGEESTFFGLGIAREASGNIVIVGNHHGTADFGAGPLVGMGAEDVLVAKIAP
jgi:beta-propeller repeat-containing protein